MFPRDVPRVLCQPVGAENFSTNRPDEPPVHTFGTTKEFEELLWSTSGWGYRCHELFICRGVLLPLAPGRLSQF